MTCYSIEPRTRKYVKEYGFLSFARNLSNKYEKQILDTAGKISLDAGMPRVIRLNVDDCLVSLGLK